MSRSVVSLLSSIAVSIPLPSLPFRKRYEKEKEKRPQNKFEKSTRRGVSARKRQEVVSCERNPEEKAKKLVLLSSSAAVVSPSCSPKGDATNMTRQEIEMVIPGPTYLVCRILHWNKEKHFPPLSNTDSPRFSRAKGSARHDIPRCQDKRIALDYADKCADRTQVKQKRAFQSPTKKADVEYEYSTAGLLSKKAHH